MSEFLEQPYEIRTPLSQSLPRTRYGGSGDVSAYLCLDIVPEPRDGKAVGAPIYPA